MIFNLEYKIDLEKEKTEENYKEKIITDFSRRFFNQLKENLNFEIERIKKTDNDKKEIETYNLKIDMPTIGKKVKHDLKINRPAKHVFSVIESKEKQEKL